MSVSVKASSPIVPVPVNEMDRLLSLSGFDVDYSDHANSFKDLAKLAAKVAGTNMSLVNLIDSLTQWTISNHGLDLEQMIREDSVCQYTIMTDDHFEVMDLSADDRFKDKLYVSGAPNARYYYGVPLRASGGLNIGALCVLDQEHKILNPEKTELLKIIADEIVSRLKTFKILDNLKNKLAESDRIQKKVAHDIRGPLGGIIGLAQIIGDQGDENQMEEVLEFASMIQKSGNSILDLAEEILSAHKNEKSGEREGHTFNLSIFKDKLEKLYSPQAKHKNLDFVVKTTEATEKITFSKNKLLQITGNLISNSMKFTPEGGRIEADLNFNVTSNPRVLIISVHDSGVGMKPEIMDAILSGLAPSTDGTQGEAGFGFGMALVKHLVDSMNGSMEITSEPGNGSLFRVTLPM